ncbi:MAG: glycosyltransferase family 39 protein, partial [Sciscionella sp.]|nr:glycosyltransferase family 39 protein [Sciscionella sp.]
MSATKTESPAAAARRWLDAAGGRWQRPALIALLAATALLYFWDLSASGYANSFYAAAVQAGTRSWKAWLFGSLDSSNAITVDKPPAALWVMVLSCRIFGFHSWSLLAPQALEGVGAVWLTYATVRRWSGPAAGLLAGGALALTPVAVLMFKFDNPDALLVLLLCAAAYCTTRAVETANLRWLLLAGGALGFGFLTKMLQAFLILPGLALVYLIAAPTGIWRRVWQLLAGGLAIVVSAGWYVLLVQLWPASSRPYISGSTDNSLMQLALGYNGLQRLSGGGSGGAIRGGDGAGPKGVPSGTGHLVTPGGGGAGGGGGFGGQTGIG